MIKQFNSLKMSYNIEEIRELFQEVETFCRTTLQKENLTARTLQIRDALLMRLENLSKYPMTELKENSPPPYIDMSGSFSNQTDSHADFTFSAINIHIGKDKETQHATDDSLYEIVKDVPTPGDADPKAENFQNFEVCTSLSQLQKNAIHLALWSYDANESNELSFKSGDLITIISKQYDNYSWWIGDLGGFVGFVPKNFLVEAYDNYNY